MTGRVDNPVAWGRGFEMSAWIRWQHQWDALVQQIRGAVGSDIADDVEDLVNTAFVKLLENPRNDVSHFRAYMRAIAVNLHRDDRRRHARRYTDHLDETGWERLQDGQPLPDYVCEIRSELYDLSERLMALAPRARQIVLLSRTEGLTFSEIAGKLGISKSAVEKQFYRAMVLLSNGQDD